MKKINITLTLLLLISNIVHADNYVENWFLATQYSQNREFSKAVEAYTQAINSLNQNQILTHLHLYNERAKAYLYLGFSDKKNYEKALQDYSLVINHLASSQIDKTTALLGRGQIYLLLGRCQDFVNDINTAEKMEPIFTDSYEEKEDYVIFKMSNRLRYDKTLENAFTKMLVVKHAVDSEKDIVFTDSGIGIIKKSKSAEAPKEPIFCE